MLAAEKGVTIDYQVSFLPGWKAEQEFDVAGIVFVHFLPEKRKR